jgi:carboxyl-terminal processing protease
MQQFKTFMMSKKGLLVWAALAFGALFFAFTNTTGIKDLKSLEQRKKLLAAIGTLLEEQHYSPKKIDDAFSKLVFSKYLEEMDGEKNLFTQSDIAALKKFETTLDDEIHGSDIKFAPAVSAIYDKRIAQAEAYCKEILAQPFDFTTQEDFVTNGDKLNYCTDEKEMKERWRKKLKYLTLERFVGLQDEREKLPKDSVRKTDEVLEKEARDRVKKIIDKTFGRIKSTYNEDQRFSTYINTITNLMDPHTDYFPPVEKRAFDEMMSGRFYGIGAQLQEQDGVIKIASLVTGGPAWKQGELTANDVIVKVAQGKEEPVDITGYDVTDAVKLIRGNKGTEVRLTVKKQDGTTKVIAIVRDEIVQDESYARSAIVKNGTSKVGYIYLPDFYADFERPDGARCSEDVAKEVIKLKKEQVDGIVIDLRNNGGGSLYEVVQMVGLFINQGPVVQVRDKDGRSSVLSDNNKSVLYDGPLAVMVNEFSASASEIFAAAIQDYKRGIVIGSSSTYGKGTVQRNVPFGKPIDYSSGRTEFGAVKLTFQKFYRVNGGSTQLKGVTPDVILPDNYEYLKVREKDNPIALPWDEINKASFQTSEDKFGYEQAIKQANAKINNNPTLQLIKQNALWLSQNNEKPVSLNVNTYKQQQKAIKTTVSQNEKLIKLQQEMAISNLTEDKDKFFNNPDKQKGERYQAWLRSLKNDLYIHETVGIVSDMIATANNTAKK